MLIKEYVSALPEELPVSSKSMLPRCRTPATTLNRSSFSVSSRPIFFMATHILLKSPWSSRRGSFRAPTFRCCKRHERVRNSRENRQWVWFWITIYSKKMRSVNTNLYFKSLVHLFHLNRPQILSKCDSKLNRGWINSPRLTFVLEKNRNTLQESVKRASISSTQRKHSILLTKATWANVLKTNVFILLKKRQENNLKEISAIYQEWWEQKGESCSV